MKFYQYIIGLLSAFFLVGWIGTLLLNIPRHWVFLLAGLVFLSIYLILYFRAKRLHAERMTEIIKKHKELKSSKKEDAKEEHTSAKGWSMNDSPFRERKSGLSWGGGNIHAAGASRNSRKSFLK